MPAANYAGEAAAAAIGLERFLETRAVRLTRSVTGDAEALERRMQREIGRFWGTRPQPPDEIDVDAEKVSRQIAEFHMLPERLGDGDPAQPGLSASTTAALYRAIAYLDTRLPAFLRATITGTESRVPSQQSLHRFQLAWQATDPLHVLRHFAARTMTALHRQGMREMWPGIFERATQLLMDDIASRKKEGRDLQTTLDQDTQLRLLLGVPRVDPTTAAAVAIARKPPPEAESAADADLGDVAGRGQTVTDRAEAV